MLTNTSDFRIVLAAADKLRSGVYARVYGDIVELQQNFVDMVLAFWRQRASVQEGTVRCCIYLFVFAAILLQ